MSGENASKNLSFEHALEDLILNTVHYFGISGQDKHIRDIAAIQVYLEDQLDWPYFAFWLDQLGLRPVWDEVQTAVEMLLL